MPRGRQSSRSSSSGIERPPHKRKVRCSSHRFGTISSESCCTITSLLCWDTLMVSGRTVNARIRVRLPISVPFLLGQATRSKRVVHRANFSGLGAARCWKRHEGSFRGLAHWQSGGLQTRVVEGSIPSSPAISPGRVSMNVHTSRAAHCACSAFSFRNPVDVPFSVWYCLHTLKTGDRYEQPNRSSSP